MPFLYILYSTDQYAVLNYLQLSIVAASKYKSAWILDIVNTSYIYAHNMYSI